MLIADEFDIYDDEILEENSVNLNFSHIWIVIVITEVLVKLFRLENNEHRCLDWKEVTEISGEFFNFSKGYGISSGF